MLHQRSFKQSRPSWMEGFIPRLDKRNPHVDKKVEDAVQRAKAARIRYLEACERVNILLNTAH